MFHIVTSQPPYGFMKYLQYIIIGTLALLCFVSCQSLSVPPGYVGATTTSKEQIVFPPELSPEARIALLRWYLSNQQGDDKNAQLASCLELTQRNIQQFENSYRIRGAAALAKRYPDYLQLNSAGEVELLSKKLKSRQDWAQLDEFFTTYQNYLTGQKAVPVPVDESVMYLMSVAFDKEKIADFNNWAKANPTLGLSTATTERNVKQLAAVQQAIALKKSIIDCRNQSEKLFNVGNSLEALNLLDKCLKGIPKNANLDILGDKNSLPEFRQLVANAPFRCINGAIDSINKLLPAKDEAALLALENTFSKEVTLWYGDSRFAKARKELSGVISKVGEKLSAEREKFWTKTLWKHIADQDFWGGARHYQHVQQLLADSSYQAFAGYRQASPNSIKHLQAQMRKQFDQILPQAIDRILQLEEEAANIHNRFGLVVVLDKMLQQLSAMVPPTSSQEVEKRSSQLGLSASRVAKARRMLLAERFRRHITIADLISIQPGIGIAYAKDMERELFNIFRRFNMNEIWVVVNSTNNPSPRDCRISGGVVADYSLATPFVSKSFTTINEYKTPRRQLNPAYLKTEGKDGVPQYQWIQEVVAQNITIETVTTQAHIRVIFTMEGQNLRLPMECNEFYDWSFVRETPGEAKVVENRITYDEKECLPVKTIGVLRNERQWTAGEMLDFARKDSLNLVVLKVLNGLLEYPQTVLSDSDKAAASGNFMVAADRKGELITFLEYMKIPNDYNKVMGFATFPKAKGYAPELANFKQNLTHLQDIAPEQLESACRLAGQGVKIELPNTKK